MKGSYLLMAVFSVCLMAVNPFPSLPLVIYSLPLWLVVIYNNVGGLFSYKTASAVEKLEIDNAKSELWKSIVRHAITAIGLALSFGLKVPYLDQVLLALKTVIGYWDTLFEAIKTVAGVVMVLIGLFKNKDRFGSRALQIIEGERID